MIPTVAQLKALSPATKFTKAVTDNITSVVIALEKWGRKYGLDQSHRLAQYLAQLSHESGYFKYDKEIWGNTPAQQKYDTRTDLGNTPAKDGDGKKYMGRSGIQLTGKGNYQAFYNWCKSEGMNPPNFVTNPELINTDPWEGLVPIWFWSKGNRTGKSLNTYADQNDIEMITRIVNGGLNGYSDRLEAYARCAFLLLGYNYNTAGIESFQRQQGMTVDGIVGPRTRSALHLAMVEKDSNKGQMTRKEQNQVTAAPVVEEKPVAVVPKNVDKPKKDLWAQLTGAVGMLGLGGFSIGSFWDGFVGLDPKVQTLIIAVTVMMGIGGLGYVAWERWKLSERAKDIKDGMDTQSTVGRTN